MIDQEISSTGGTFGRLNAKNEQRVRHLWLHTRITVHTQTREVAHTFSGALTHTVRAARALVSLLNPSCVEIMIIERTAAKLTVQESCALTNKRCVVCADSHHESIRIQSTFTTNTVHLATDCLLPFPSNSSFAHHHYDDCNTGCIMQLAVCAR